MTIPKKRGRKSTAAAKPKSTTTNGDTNKKTDKKRGRKPKQKSYSVQGVPVDKLVDNNEHIILHFPFKSKDVYQDDLFSPCQDKLLEYSPELSEPQPYSADYSSHFATLTQEDNLSHVCFLDKENQYDNIKSNDILSYVEEEKEIPNTNVKEIDDIVPMDTYLDTDVYIQNSMSPYKNEKIIMRKNLNNIQYEFMDSNKKGEWPESTNIYCMWCCHPFEGPPCAIPVKYIDDKFYVSGCFCSFNCATAYNFQDYKSGDVWERYSLLNLMYKLIYEKSFTKIKAAPPREVLSIFGGYLNIDDYRKNMIQNIRDYKIIRPPIISMVPKVEESIIEYNSNNPIPVDTERLNNAAKKLRLKRQKPLMNQTHTLENFMDLTYYK